MPDDKTKRPQDASEVNVHEPYEVKYWTDKWTGHRAASEGCGDESRRDGEGRREAPGQAAPLTRVSC